MIIPNYLKDGDCIGLISTARKISQKELEFGLRILQELGLKVILGENIFSEYRQFAGTDIQ